MSEIRDAGARALAYRTLDGIPGAAEYEYAERVVAAVTPLIRAEVLREASDLLHRRAAKNRALADGCTSPSMGRAFLHRATALRGAAKQLAALAAERAPGKGATP